MARKRKDDAVLLKVITNDRQDFKVDMLETLYKGVKSQQVAYMDGMHPETGEIVPLLVGLEPKQDGTTDFFVWPLARILVEDKDLVHYLVPDGRGNYVDGRTEA